MPKAERLSKLAKGAGAAVLMAASVAMAQEGAPRGRTPPTPAQIAAQEKQNADDAKAWNAAPAPSDPRDLQGVWWISRPEFAYRPITNPPLGQAAPLAPMTPAEAASRQRRHDLDAAGTPAADPSNDCLSLGVPNVMSWPYPFQIDYLPGQIVFLLEVQHNVRFVHMDGRPVPASEPASYQGYSRGHWEGNTLVIDSDHFNDKTQIDEDGLSHGPKLKVHEEITKFTNKYGGAQLRDLITIDDPDHYTHPWTAERLYDWRGDVTLTEYSCEENNRNRSANGLIRAN